MPQEKKAVYKRILLKLSGELLKGDRDFGFDPASLKKYAAQIKRVMEAGVQPAIVVGGGNVFRGAAAFGMERAVADSVGMLATLMNALMLEDVFEKMGVKTAVLSAIPVHNVAEPMVRRRAIQRLEEGRVALFACGTGNPFFTTDTAAALRANEIGADVLLKGTRVRGVFSGDPEKDPDARFYEDISYGQVLKDDLRVMDAAAFALCRDNDLPVIVFDVTKDDALERIVRGEKVGTLVHGG